MAGDDPAAGGPGCMRASRADREQVIEVLKVAFVHGRLTKDEFDVRVSQALVPRTLAELSALTADILAGPVAARPSWLTKPKPVTALTCVTVGAVSLFGLPYLVTVLTGGGPLRAQTVVFLIVVLAVLSVPLATVLLRTRFGKQSALG